MRIFKLKKRHGLIAAALVTAAIATTAVVAAAVSFGPSRPTYTWANPADHITFNSITDNPDWGDERHLLKARNLTSPTTEYATSTHVTNGEHVVLAIYFHNNAAGPLNLVAHNVTAKFALPTNAATTITPTAYISASNATPSQVFATADLVGDKPFTIKYEPGTAKLYTNNVSGATISDNVVGSGTLIGTNGTDGNVPGCAQFSGFVTIRVTVEEQAPAPKPPVLPPAAKTVTVTQELPNTGPADVFKIFAGSSVLGTVGHYVLRRRRN